MNGAGVVLCAHAWTRQNLNLNLALLGYLPQIRDELNFNWHVRLMGVGWLPTWASLVVWPLLGLCFHVAMLAGWFDSVYPRVLGEVAAGTW